MIFHYEYKIIVIANEVKEKFQNICIFAYIFLKKQADRCIPKIIQSAVFPDGFFDL